MAPVFVTASVDSEAAYPVSVAQPTSGGFAGQGASRRLASDVTRRRLERTWQSVARTSGRWYRASGEGCLSDAVQQFEEQLLLLRQARGRGRRPRRWTAAFVHLQ